MIIIASGFVLHIRAPCHISRFVTADARFGSPKRKMPAFKIEIRHLFSAAIAFFSFIRRNSEPKAVNIWISLFKIYRQKFLINTYFGFQSAEINLCAVRCPGYAHHIQRIALYHIIFNLKIPPVHVNRSFTVSHIQRGLLLCMFQIYLIVTANCKSAFHCFQFHAHLSFIF